MRTEQRPAFRKKCGATCRDVADHGRAADQIASYDSMLARRCRPALARSACSKTWTCARYPRGQYHRGPHHDRGHLWHELSSRWPFQLGLPDSDHMRIWSLSVCSSARSRGGNWQASRRRTDAKSSILRRGGSLCVTRAVGAVRAVRFLRSASKTASLALSKPTRPTARWLQTRREPLPRTDFRVTPTPSTSANSSTEPSAQPGSR